MRREIQRLARIIDAPSTLLPTIEASPEWWDAHPNIRFEGPIALYEISERGILYSSDRCTGLDDLLYRAFENVTFSMALKREVALRNEGEDSRRQLFQIQMDLIGLLSPAWAKRLQVEIDAILEEAPYVD